MGFLNIWGKTNYRGEYIWNIRLDVAVITVSHLLAHGGQSGGQEFGVKLARGVQLVRDLPPQQLHLAHLKRRKELVLTEIMIIDV